ncbi:phosphoribosyltransferase [Candidatus Woesearchaeota archaeon]|nr:phosphoribosyltransferase [Candidatus Woesearchaeota archaeon]
MWLSAALAEGTTAKTANAIAATQRYLTSGDEHDLSPIVYELMEMDDAAPPHVLQLLGEQFLRGDRIPYAIDVFTHLDDYEKLHTIGEQCLRTGRHFQALRVFERLGDMNGLEEIIKRERNNIIGECAVEAYLGGLSPKFTRGFRQYAKRKIGKQGDEAPEYYFLRDDNSNLLAQAAHTAARLARTYDFGIGIASGGLWLSYVMEMYGLPVLITGPQKRGKGVRWRTIDDLSGITDKKVLVLENDVATGKTLQKAAEEIMRFSPRQLDLLLVIDYNWGVPDSQVYNRVPSEFGKVYAVNRMQYSLRDIQELKIRIANYSRSAASAP